MILCFCIAGVIILISWVVYNNDESIKSLVYKKWVNREPLTDEKFGKKYYPGNEDIAIRVRALIKERLKMDVSRMQPGDELIKDLLMEEIDSLASLELVMDMEKEFGIEISDEDAQKVMNVHDMIDLIIRLLELKKSQSPT